MDCSSDEADNIPGRFVNRLWPEVLRKLRDDVAPKYADLWTDIPEFVPNNLSLTAKRIEFELRIEDELNSHGSMLILSRWGSDFGIQDKWIFDAAVKTIIWNYGNRNVRGRWFWLPPEPANPPFSPTIRDKWYPSESWGNFQERVGAQINGQLAQYRRDCRRRNNTSKPEVTRDAEWTVRYQRGARAKDIAAELYRRYNQPEQAVYRAIVRFAKDIGLTLRSRRRRKPQ